METPFKKDSTAETFLDSNSDHNVNQETEQPTSLTQDEDESSQSEATIRFEVNNISALNEKALSPPTSFRNLPWRLMVVPRENHNHNRNVINGLGIFLQCNADSDSTSWSCRAFAEFKIVSNRSSDEDFTKTMHHTYDSKENDWGFKNIISWKDLVDPHTYFIKDDTLILEAWVTADAPHGVKWDSKKHTGFVGLKNQGATCYMNSLLQTLFFTNQLRNAVYHIPTECEDSSSSIPLALQRVFYELQFSNEPVGTKKLTNSFGWDTVESFRQHDVQELCRVLLDNIESKMKGTCVDGTIPRLYEGKTISFVRCKNVDYSSTRVETYYDIQLNVKGNENIYKSFEDYCEIESLHGDNKYDAGEHGLQDADKGIIFESFPPVLHLHLLRFQYDPATDNNIKINDRYEFLEKLNLDVYLINPEDTPATYTLYAVLVHSGTNQSGHYVVFIKPISDDKKDVDWCKFDDDVVANCTEKDAIDYNFGGDINNILVRHTTNAYMLVYVRDSAMNQVLQTVGEDAIPKQLKERFDEERKIEVLRKKEKQEEHLYLCIYTLVEDSFFGYQGNDLFDAKDVNYFTFKVMKNLKVGDVLKLISEQMRYPSEMLRIWPFVYRNDANYRPRALNEEELKIEICQLTDNSRPWIVFLERLQPDSEATALPEFNSETQVLLFFKFYDPQIKKMEYCGHAYMLKASKVRELIPIVTKKEGLPINTPLNFYEEVESNMVTRIEDLDQSLEKSLEGLKSSNIIVFQRSDLNLKNCALPTVIDYFRELFYSVEVTFCDVTKPDDDGFVLIMSLKLEYDLMAKYVGHVLKVDPYSIQFYRWDAYRDEPGAPLKYPFEGTLKDVLGLMKMRKVKKVFYKLLSIRIDELEHKRQFKIFWMNNYLFVFKELIVYTNNDGTINDILEEVMKQVRLPNGGSGKLRLVEITNFRISDLFLPHQSINILSTIGTGQLRAEEIPLKELDLADDELLVPVNHFHLSKSITFGVPFFIKVKHGESFRMMKERIKQKLNLPEKELEEFKFAFMNISPQNFDAEVDGVVDLRTLLPEKNLFERPWIGLEHVNKSKRYQGFHYHETALKIHN